MIHTNYHSTRALTEKILLLLSIDGKIINISSAAGKWFLHGQTLLKIFTNLDFEDKDLENVYNITSTERLLLLKIGKKKDS